MVMALHLIMQHKRKGLGRAAIVLKRRSDYMLGVISGYKCISYGAQKRLKS